jgi:hypothetical protein
MNISRSAKPTFTHTVLSVAAVLMLTLYGSGCDSGKQAAQTQAAAGRDVTASGSTPPVDSTPDPDSARNEIKAGDVAQGTFRIELSGTGVAIRANAANEKDILSSLAAKAGFQLTDAGAAWKVVTLNVDASSVHAALAQLLRKQPYQIIYEYDRKRQTDALTQVIVGKNRAAMAMRRNAGREAANVTTEAQASRERIKIKHAGTASNPDADQQIYLNQLLDTSPAVRAEAAENIEPTGPALDYLTQMLTSDPAPEVRAAASHALQDSDDPKALDALTTGLGESDPKVLVEIIDALGFVGNSQTISQLQPFLQNPNEDVRDAAQSSIDLLE